MASKFRLVPVLLLAVLIVVAGCSMLTPKANAGIVISWSSQQDNMATQNLGTITLSPGDTFGLPANLGLLGSTTPLTYNPAPGYYFVMWKIGGPLSVANPYSQSTTLSIVAGSGEAIVAAIYSAHPPGSVGGIVLPTNTFMTFAPYLAMIGLVATTAAVAIKKRMK